MTYDDFKLVCTECGYVVDDSGIYNNAPAIYANNVRRSYTDLIASYHFNSHANSDGSAWCYIDSVTLSESDKMYEILKKENLLSLLERRKKYEKTRKKLERKRAIDEL